MNMTTTAIKERPVLFNAPMVRAILDGRKTMTRRVVKNSPLAKNAERVLSYHGKTEFDFILPNGSGHIVPCPYGEPGERLWVRETVSLQGFYCDDANYPPLQGRVAAECPVDARMTGIAIYKADGAKRTVRCLAPMVEGNCHWRPSIHMPRWASRLTLEITDVRVERVQDISEKDAIAEGILEWTKSFRESGTYHPNGQLDAYPSTAFLRLWDEINGEGAAKENPWVWVVSFKRV